MSRAGYARQRRQQHPDESILYAFNFEGYLESDETLTGTPNAEVLDGKTATLGTPTIQTTAYTEPDGQEIGASKAVRLRVSGLTDGEEYEIKVTAESSKGNTLVLIGILECTTGRPSACTC